MKSLAIAALAATMLSTPAFATDWRVGAEGGWTAQNQGDINLNVSTQANSVLGFEGDYDNTFTPLKAFKTVDEGVQEFTAAQHTNELAADAVLGYPNTSRFYPYVKGGLGYQWTPHGSEPTWNVGLGARYHLIGAVDLDGQYRRVEGFTSRQGADQFTLGFGVKF